MPTNSRSGFVKLIILVIIAILILSYFGINLKSVVESDTAQNNFSYVWRGVTFVWDNYLSKPLTYFWNNIFLDLIWKTFTNTFEGMRDNGTLPFSDISPKVSE